MAKGNVWGRKGKTDETKYVQSDLEKSIFFSALVT